MHARDGSGDTHLRDRLPILGTAATAAREISISIPIGGGAWGCEASNEWLVDACDAANRKHSSQVARSRAIAGLEEVLSLSVRKEADESRLPFLFCCSRSRAI